MTRGEYDELRTLLDAISVRHGIQVDCLLRSDPVEVPVAGSLHTTVKPGATVWKVTLVRNRLVDWGERVEWLPYDPDDFYFLRAFLRNVLMYGVSAPLPSSPCPVTWLIRNGLAIKPWAGYATMGAA